MLTNIEYSILDSINRLTGGIEVVENMVLPSTSSLEVVTSTSSPHFKQVAIVCVLHQEGQHTVKAHVHNDGSISTDPIESTEEGK